MGKRLIEPVEDNLDKQKTYKRNILKYNAAVNNGFYFEAMLIVYAMMEDRLKSYLYHMGALKSRKSYKIDCPKTKQFLQDIVAQYKRGWESCNLGISSISGKIKIVRCTLIWASLTDEEKLTGYQSVLKSRLEKVDIEALLECLCNIESWCKYRNEVIHALLNKNMDSLDEQLSVQVQDGMKLARTLDAELKVLKKYDTIRKKINLPSEQEWK